MFNPGFYGFMPLRGLKKKILQVAMMVMSFCHLLMRCVCYAVLWSCGSSFFIIFFCGDMALFLLCKLVRRDSRYCLRLDGIASFFVSLIWRLVVKLVNDFTAMPHLRHPFELGGAYWLYSMIWSAVSLGISLVIKQGQQQPQIKVLDLEYICLGLTFTWAVSFGVMMTCAESKFRHTFWNTKTSRDHAYDNFVNGSEAARMNLFTLHSSLWMPFKKQISSWLEENWDNWYIESPIWFNNHMIALIPDDILPSGVEEMTLEKRKISKSRRRSSLSQLALEVILKNVGDKHNKFETKTDKEKEKEKYIFSD